MATVWRLTFLTTNTLNGVDQATGMHYQTDTSVLGDEPSAATVLTQPHTTLVDERRELAEVRRWYDSLGTRNRRRGA
jgi:hypothetical protein